MRLIRFVVAICVFCQLLSVQASAQPQSGHNTLNDVEIADGWILLFDGDSDYGWKQESPNWKAVDGELAASKVKGGASITTTTEFKDFELRAQVWIEPKTDVTMAVRAPVDSEINGATSYLIDLGGARKEQSPGSIAGAGKAKSNVRTTGKWVQVEVTAEGDHLVVKLDRRLTADILDSKYARGVIAFMTDGKGVAKVRRVMLRPTKMESLFNGKDLTGWSLVPGHKSVFSVTPDGWLNVKDGSGDLHSDRAFGNFCFQIEVISNGDHLNSGVFFRANKGAFWSGYEAQIRNQWVGDDRTKAVDFGTGGIYNYQPARRVISTDKQWFTMTVVAVGLHLSTWVNGIQVTDFQDKRPVDETNARKGARTKPGVFTLQGHDPTTDLNFRRIRVQDYDSK